jgi:hypothetical protein
LVSWTGIWERHLLARWFLAWFILDPEDVGDMFLHNLGWLSTDYKALRPRRQNSTNIYFLGVGNFSTRSVSRLYEYSVEKNDEWWIWKDLEGNYSRLMEVLYQKLSRGTEENYENPQPSLLGNTVFWNVTPWSLVPKFYRKMLPRFWGYKSKDGESMILRNY